MSLDISSLTNEIISLMEKKKVTKKEEKKKETKETKTGPGIKIDIPIKAPIPTKKESEKKKEEKKEEPKKPEAKKVKEPLEVPLEEPEIELPLPKPKKQAEKTMETTEETTGTKEKEAKKESKEPEKVSPTEIIAKVKKPEPEEEEIDEAEKEFTMPAEELEDIEIEEDIGEETEKMVVVIFGDKGTGKTVTALSFPGKVVALSFDRKTAPIKKRFYKNPGNIIVFDAVKYMRWDPKVATKYAEKTYHYIMKILDYVEKKVKPDWIVIDNTEILEQILELVMRYRHGLKPFQGIRNLNVWKERKYLLRDIHNRALGIAKRGIIYTTYTTYEEVIAEGELVARKEMPKWIDIIMFEADVVLQTVYNSFDKVFYVKVITSKFDDIIPTGETYDVTNKPFGKQIRWNL